jgi:hypothetical protein
MLSNRTACNAHYTLGFYRKTEFAGLAYPATEGQVFSETIIPFADTDETRWDATSYLSSS